MFSTFYLCCAFGLLQVFGTLHFYFICQMYYVNKEDPENGIVPGNTLLEKPQCDDNNERDFSQDE